MATYKNRPQITNIEAVKEVASRTGLPVNAAFTAVKCYQDIIMECVNSGVEIKVGDIGVITYKVKPPHYNVVYYDFTSGDKLPPKNTPGFWIPYLRPSRKWKAELKELTKFWNEENEEKENSD